MGLWCKKKHREYFIPSCECKSRLPHISTQSLKDGGWLKGIKIDIIIYFIFYLFSIFKWKYYFLIVDLQK